MRSARYGIVIALFVMCGGRIAHGQFSLPRAEVAPIVGSDGVHPGDELRVAMHVRLPSGFHMQSDGPRDPLLIPTVVTVDAPDGIAATEVVFPSPTDLDQLGSDQPLAVFDQEFVIGVRLSVGAAVKEGTVTVPVHLRYQSCNDTTCFPPATADAEWTFRVVAPGVPVVPQYADVLGAIAFGRGKPLPRAAVADLASLFPALAPAGVAQLSDFAVAGTTGGYLGTDAFLTFIGNAEKGVKETGLFDGRGPLAIVLIVLLGGLALNLTPCVLPMIPINLAIIGAGAQAGSRVRGFLLGGTYGLAMAVVYGVLGLVVIMTASTFGTINASPWFNLGIAALFVVLGLAMFDLLAIDFSSLSSKLRLGHAARGSFMLSFTMGAVAALLAGACVAPVVIQVVLFSSNLYATGTSVALALPFLLGVGMALPWPLAGAGLAALPRPGLWMVRVKYAFGVVILATAGYYGYLAYQIFDSRRVDPTSVSSSVEEQLKAGWYGSLDEGLAVAAREQKPVLIDMWATWCKNCLTMDKTTFQDPAVKSALDGYVKIKFQAEQPDAPGVQSVMQRFGAVGLPTYAIIRP
jgi:cytochrome c biogenesis protein CcdA/thiol-disulfide isomerase/thioredoxin